MVRFYLWMLKIGLFHLALQKQRRREEFLFEEKLETDWKVNKGETPEDEKSNTQTFMGTFKFLTYTLQYRESIVIVQNRIQVWGENIRLGVFWTKKVFFFENRRPLLLGNFFYTGCWKSVEPSFYLFRG